MTPAFRRWLRHYGVPRVVEELARHGTPVSHQAAYGWVSGRTLPARPRIPVLLRMAAGSLSVEDLTTHVRPIARSRGLMPPRRGGR